MKIKDLKTKYKKLAKRQMIIKQTLKMDSFQRTSLKIQLKIHLAI